VTRAGICAAIALAACGGGKQHDEHEGHGERPKHGEHDEHGRGEHGRGEHAQGPEARGGKPTPGQVRIAPEMIRDLRVTTAKAEARPAGERVSVLGELRVNEDAYAEVAAPISARVVKVLAKAGDSVTVGQPLVELHSPDLGKARAEVQATNARVEIARKHLERKRALAADRLVPEREVIEAEAALTEAQATSTVAAAALRTFGTGGGGGMMLKAPVAGTVIERTVVMGQLADPSKTLFRIGDLSKLWLVAHVFERDAVRVRVGTKATASFAALPGDSVEATIAWIGRAVDPASRTIPVRLEVGNATGALRPGMSATVSLPLGDTTGTVVAVPIAAVQRVDDGWAVFVPRGEGVFDVRPIGRGRDLGGEVEVLSGLAPGHVVVVDGAFLLKAESDKARNEGGDHDHH
jgi:cobalt-zinc-cadmium efflux system membrane fusion protein